MKTVLHNAHNNQPWLEIRPEDAAEALALRYMFENAELSEIGKKLVIYYQHDELSNEPTD